MIDSTQIFISGAAVAAAAAFMGVFVILRRMALTVDAMTHVALPGLALGILYNFNPFLGGFAALFIAVFLILFIEERTRHAAETVISILFTAALAVGALIIPEEHLVEALFGDISGLSQFDFWLLLFGSVFAAGVVIVFFRQFCRTALSDEFSQAEGLPARRYYLIYLLLLAFLVALGIKIVGTLMMSALIVFPAAAAKNISRSISGMVLWSVFLGAAAILGGLWLSMRFLFPPGPFVVLVALAFFGLGALKRRSN